MINIYLFIEYYFSVILMGFSQLFKKIFGNLKKKILLLILILKLLTRLNLLPYP